jgi:hypothetical protein
MGDQTRRSKGASKTVIIGILLQHCMELCRVHNSTLLNLDKHISQLITYIKDETLLRAMKKNQRI